MVARLGHKDHPVADNLKTPEPVDNFRALAEARGGLRGGGCDLWVLLGTGLAGFGGTGLGSWEGRLAGVIR
jgi:hypothetical protein